MINMVVAMTKGFNSRWSLLALTLCCVLDTTSGGLWPKLGFMSNKENNEKQTKVDFFNKRLGDIWNDGDLVMNYTENGIKYLGCSTNGGLRNISSRFTENGIWKSCDQEKGVVSHGCVDLSHSNVEFAFKTRKTIDRLRWMCDKEKGWIFEGCERKDQNLKERLIQGTLAADEETFEENGVTKKCTQAGIVSLGCEPDNGAMSLNDYEDHSNWWFRVHELFLEKKDGRAIQCNEDSAEVVGCALDNRPISLDAKHYGEANAVHVCDGSKKLKFEGCRLDETDAKGSTYLKSKLLKSGEKISESGFWRKCSKSSGIVALGCSESGYKPRKPLDTIVEDNGIGRQCTIRGMVDLGCFSDSHVHVPVDGFFVDEGVWKTCSSKEGIKLLGCVYGNETLKFGSSFTDNYGSVKQCKKTGIVSTGCVTSDDAKTTLKLGKKIQVGFLQKQCTKRGLETINCRRKPAQNADNTFEDFGLIKECVQYNDMVLRGCRVGSSSQVVRFQDEFHDSEVTLRCTERGLVPVQCRHNENGKQLLLGESFVENGITKKCTVHGIAYVGCQHQGIMRRIGERFSVGERQYLCTRSKLLQTGCMLNNGAFFYNLGKQFQMQGLLKECTEHGVRNRGCLLRGGTPVAIGEIFRQNTHMTQLCTDAGIVGVSCTYDDRSPPVPVNSQYIHKDMVWKCLESSSIAIGCSTKSGTVQLGQQYHESGLQNVCTLNGGKTLGCTSFGSGKPVAVGERFRKNDVIYECTPEKPMVRGCIPWRRNDTKTVGQIFFSHGMNMICAPDGNIVPLNCPHKNGKILEAFKTVVEGDLVMQCISGRGIVPIKCWSGKAQREVDFYTQINDGENVTKICQPTGFDTVSCAISSPNGSVVAIPRGETHGDGNWLYECQAEGLVKVGCVHEATNLRWDESMTDSKHVERKCTSEGLKNGDCLSVNGAVKQGKFREGKFLMECGKDGVRRVGCAAETYSLLLDERVCTFSGVEHRCTKTGLVPVACRLQHTNMQHTMSYTTANASSATNFSGPCNAGERSFFLHQSFDDADFQKQCTRTGIRTTGCVTQKHGIVKLNQAFYDEDSQLKCTETGVEVIGCRGRNKDLDLESYIEELGFEWHCEETGLEISGCLTSQGTKKVGERLTDGEFIAHCTVNGTYRIGCAHMTLNNLMFGDTFVRNQMNLTCSVDGIKPVGCILSNADDNNKLNKTLLLKQHTSIGEFEMECKENGLRSIGCKNDNGMWRHFGEEFKTKNFWRKCTEKGVLELGCKTWREGKLIPPDQPFVDDDGLLKKCTRLGPKVQMCRGPDNIVKNVGQTWTVNADNMYRDLQIVQICQPTVEGIPKVVSSQCKVHGDVIPDNCYTVYSRNLFAICKRDPNNKDLLRLTVENKVPSSSFCEVVVAKEGTISYWHKTTIAVRIPGEKCQQNNGGVFIQGGISPSRRQGCGGQVEEDPCSIPIKHVTAVNNSNTKNDQLAAADHHLNWQAPSSANQQNKGTPLFCSSQSSPKTHNRFGPELWTSELRMDCSRTLDGWFEFNIVANDRNEDAVSSGGQCSGDKATAVPFKSSSHVGLCGAMNIVTFNSADCSIESHQVN